MCAAGCDRPQLEHIAKRGTAVRKVSRRDMPWVLGSGLDGATTVSGTMLLAARAGIKVFVTGGIGGVHR
jgi:pseudouridine-5'-phosphate glycosidase